MPGHVISMLAAQPAGHFWRELVVHVGAAILLIIAGHLVLSLSHAISRFSQIRRNFSLGGAWIGTCKLPSYPDKATVVEIYRLAIKNNLVDLCLFSYRSYDATVHKYVGAGSWRSHILALFYYEPEHSSVESGVIHARLVGNTIKGMYAQYDAMADEKLFVSDETFILKRVHLPMWAQIRLVFGFKPVHLYSQALALYQKAEPHSPVTVASDQ